MMTGSRIGLAAVGGALLLAGCGGGGGSAAGGGGSVSAASNWPTKDGCKALTPVAITAAVGKPVVKVEPGPVTDSEAATLTLCSWYLDEMAGSAVGLLLRTSKDDSYSESEVAKVRSAEA